MTDAERWQEACRRSGVLLQRWLDKSPMFKMTLPAIAQIAAVLQAAILEKIEMMLAMLEEGMKE